MKKREEKEARKVDKKHKIRKHHKKSQEDPSTEKEIKQM